MKDIGKGYENWIGIYYIKCLSTGNMYIGSSINIRERWQPPQEWFEGSYSYIWKKKVLESENLIVYISDKFITFPFLLPCDEETHHIITPEYHQKLKEETPMPI